jgi:hypothetical protein
MGLLKKNNIEIAKTELGEAVYIGSDVESTMVYVTKNNIKGIIISHDKGFRDTNVDFLKKYSFIENLIIQYYGSIDLTGIHSLINLKRMALNIIANDNQLIDFTCFPHIETCMFDWRPKAKSIFKCKSLKYLRINKLKKNDLTDFKELSNLEVLKIASSSIKTLKGIETLKLNTLGLYYLNSLVSLVNVDGLASTLKELDIQTCKKINNIKDVASLVNLEKLGINNCGEIESIKPVSSLKRLYRFEFWESTNIMDGDITPCLSLKEVAFQNRKHYTHTNEEIDNIIKK